MTDYPRVNLDVESYIAQITSDGASGRCFICDIVAGAEGHRVIYRDDVCVAFFNRYPRLVGYVLVAPLEHKTQLVDDFTEDEYLALQRRVYAIGRAITRSVETERLYAFSLGSNQAVSHVHWHLAPLPPGVPFMEQQFEAVNRDDYLDIPDEDKAELVRSIAANLEL